MSQWSGSSHWVLSNKGKILKLYNAEKPFGELFPELPRQWLRDINSAGLMVSGCLDFNKHLWDMTMFWEIVKGRNKNQIF